MELQWRNIKQIELPNYKEYLIDHQPCDTENLLNDRSEQKLLNENNYLGKIKSPKRKRASFTYYQRKELEKEFKNNKYVTELRSCEIAYRLKMSNLQVRTWFRNKRRKLITEQTNVDFSVSLNSSCSSSNSSTQSLDTIAINSDSENININIMIPHPDSDMGTQLCYTYDKYMKPLYFNETTGLTYTQI